MTKKTSAEQLEHELRQRKLRAALNALAAPLRGDGMRYCRNHSLYGEMPKSIPKGRVLAHNRFAFNNGFRCWTWPKENVPPGFAPCHCGSLNGLPHVADEDGRRNHGGDL